MLKSLYYDYNNFNFLPMIIEFEIVLLEMYNYTKRQNSCSTDAMAAQASKVPLQLVDESDDVDAIFESGKWKGHKGARRVTMRMYN